MNRTVQFIIGLLAISLAIAAGIYGRNTYLKEVSTYQIPVPVAEIAPYSVLTSEMFALHDMPRTMENLPYYQKVEDLTGLISVSSLPAGLPDPPNLPYSDTEQFPEFPTTPPRPETD